MSTPQDPGGDRPQDPADPQNPYGTPPPPPPNVPPPSDPPTTAIPPAPPVYGTEPTGAPSTPPPTTPPAAPPYGDQTAPSAAPAQPSYAQPGYPQPAYGQPAYGQPGPQYGATAPEEPGKGMAIAALIISFFGCVVIGALIAIPLAIVVLVRSKDGRNHGKGLAVSAIVVSLLTLAIPVIGVAVGVNYVSSLTDVNDLESGDCITADGLTDSESDTVTDIKTVGCSEDHDGEVLATVELTEQQADEYETTPFSVICDPAIAEEGKTELLSETVTYTALTVADPEEGDTAACVAYNSDGSQLTSALGS